MVALLAGLAVAGAANAQNWVGQPKVSPEVEAALAQSRAGDRSALDRLAEAGRSDAQSSLGVFLAFSPEVRPADQRMGCRYLEAASATRADAMHFLGEAYQYGRCGTKDLEKAVATFHKAGDMGLAKSRCAESNVLLELGGRDKARVVALCREGADAGDADAQTDIGNFYLAGKIVPRDMAAARGWYEKAAAQRQKNAAFVLAQIYWNGDGVTKDNAHAAQLWRVAYEEGRKDAALWLGNEALIRSRIGADVWDPVILDEAAQWFDRAAKEGEAVQRSEAVERRDLARQLIGVMQRLKGR